MRIEPIAKTRPFGQARQPSVLDQVRELESNINALREQIGFLRRELTDERLARNALEGAALGQCKIDLEATWGQCAPGQTGNMMPVQSSGLTPRKGGEATWSGWQIASSWNGGPYSCIRARLVCRSAANPN